MASPTPDQIARFAEDVARLAPADAQLLIAVSGGPDSLALLLLAHGARADRIACATVDHGLRAEGAEEAAMVARYCADFGVPHTRLHPDPPLALGTNVQARARAARYDALAAHALATGCTAILTAHHADDQAETLLMRASRGSGVDGLAGVRARTMWGAVPVLRPLLGWRRAELIDIVANAGLVPADDPTNRDPAHDRTRFRALIAASELDATGLARSAAALADASDALAWSMERIAADRIRREGQDVTVDPTDLPREYRRRLLVLALTQLGTSEPRGPSLDRLLATLDVGGTGTLGGVRASPSATKWRFREAPPRRSH